MARLRDWHVRLTAYLAATAQKPVEFGDHDCALFLAGGVLAQTGVDYAAGYRGRYTTYRGGLRILRADGFSDHVALAHHHLEKRATAFLRPGDGALVEVDEGPALGLVQGSRVYLVGYERCGTVPLTAAKYGFAV